MNKPPIMTPLLAEKIRKDRATADREEANCTACPGLDNCPNETKGHYQVICYYADYHQPYLAVGQCKRLRELRKQGRTPGEGD